MVAKFLYATMKPLPGQEHFVRTALSNLAEKVRAEPGNVRFEVYETDNGVLHVEETYENENAFQAHMDTQHGKEFNKSIANKVENGGSTVVFLNPVSTTSK